MNKKESIWAQMKQAGDIHGTFKMRKWRLFCIE